MDEEKGGMKAVRNNDGTDEGNKGKEERSVERKYK
jgi:hypothetical protein